MNKFGIFYGGLCVRHDSENNLRLISLSLSYYKQRTKHFLRRSAALIDVVVFQLIGLAGVRTTCGEL